MEYLLYGLIIGFCVGAPMGGEFVMWLWRRDRGH